MAERDVVVVDSGKAGWFVAGGVIVAALIAIVLYFNGTFDNSRSVNIEFKVPEITLPAGD